MIHETVIRITTHFSNRRIKTPRLGVETGYGASFSRIKHNSLSFVSLIAARSCAAFLRPGNQACLWFIWDYPLASMPRKPASRFARFAQSVAIHAGRPVAFGFAAGFLIAWLIVGPLMEYHPLWERLFGFVTGVVTFLMVFLIQNTQNRDTEAIHIKLDELLRATKGARIDLLDSEDLDEEDLDKIREFYEDLADKARKKEESGDGGDEPEK